MSHVTKARPIRSSGRCHMSPKDLSEVTYHSMCGLESSCTQLLDASGVFVAVPAPLGLVLISPSAFKRIGIPGSRSRHPLAPFPGAVSTAPIQFVLPGTCSDGFVEAAGPIYTRIPCPLSRRPRGIRSVAHHHHADPKCPECHMSQGRPKLFPGYSRACSDKTTRQDQSWLGL